MLELAERLLPVLSAGAHAAVATSIDVTGSSPHPAGTSMVVTDRGDVLGSVSGGCVEDAALRDCRALLQDGRARVQRFGFGDAAAARAGLACGGELDVLVHLLDPRVEDELRAVVEGRPAVVALVTSGPAAVLGRTITLATADDALRALPEVDPGLLTAALEGRRDMGLSGAAEVVCGGIALRLFVDVAAPRPRMVVAGATETAAALTAAAVAAGYLVTVCDPRAAFLAPARFPGARVVVGRAHEVVRDAALTARDAVCVLGHDEDLDPLTLATALESDAGYVGALGSRSTARRRLDRLADLGTPPAAVERLRMPIGLDLGARTPAELAIAILAEVLAVRTRSGGAPLRVGRGPIHRDLAVR